MAISGDTAARPASARNKARKSYVVGEPRTREEAIRANRNYWIVERPEPLRTLAMIDQEIAEHETELVERSARANAIRNGYAPPPVGRTMLMHPGCERECPECSLTCTMTLRLVDITRESLAKLKVERDKVVKAERPSNVIDFASARQREGR